MLGKNHFLIGAAAAIIDHQILISDLDMYGFIAIGTTGAVGALLPDIDHPNSIINQRLQITKIIGFIFRHRGITHSALAVALLMLLGYFLLDFEQNETNINYILFRAFIVGYISHIVADWMTVSGVPLFYPSKVMFRSPLPFSTGSFYEYGVSALVLASTCSYFLYF